MEFRKSQDRGIVVIEPEGRIDTTTAHEFEETLISELEEGNRRFLIDFGSVEYISSAGLRILLMLAKKLARDDDDLVLCSMNQNVKEVFEISGFTSVFDIATRRATAMKRLTLSPETLERVDRVLALWGVKPSSVAEATISETASLGYELVTGERLHSAAPSPAEAPPNLESADRSVSEKAKAEAEAALKKLGGWIGRLGKR